MSDSHVETDLTTLEAKVNAVLADLESNNPEVYTHLVGQLAAAKQLPHIEASFNERADAVFKAAIRLVMTASNRKNLLVTDDNMEQAEQAVLDIAEVNGNVKYTLR